MQIPAAKREFSELQAAGVLGTLEGSTNRLPLALAGTLVDAHIEF